MKEGQSRVEQERRAKGEEGDAEMFPQRLASQIEARKNLAQRSQTQTSNTYAAAAYMKTTCSLTLQIL